MFEYEILNYDDRDRKWYAGDIYDSKNIAVCIDNDLAEYLTDISRKQGWIVHSAGGQISNGFGPTRIILARTTWREMAGEVLSGKGKKENAEPLSNLLGRPSPIVKDGM